MLEVAESTKTNKQNTDMGSTEVASVIRQHFAASKTNIYTQLVIEHLKVGVLIWLKKMTFLKTNQQKTFLEKF